MKAIDEVDCDSAQHFLQQGGNAECGLGVLGGLAGQRRGDAALARQAPRLLPG